MGIPLDTEALAVKDPPVKNEGVLGNITAATVFGEIEAGFDLIQIALDQAEYVLMMFEASNGGEVRVAHTSGATLVSSAYRPKTAQEVRDLATRTTNAVKAVIDTYRTINRAQKRMLYWVGVANKQGFWTPALKKTHNALVQKYLQDVRKVNTKVINNFPEPLNIIHVMADAVKAGVITVAQVKSLHDHVNHAVEKLRDPAFYASVKASLESLLV